MRTMSGGTAPPAIALPMPSFVGRRVLVLLVVPVVVVLVMVRPTKESEGERGLKGSGGERGLKNLLVAISWFDFRSLVRGYGCALRKRCGGGW